MSNIRDSVDKHAAGHTYSGHVPEYLTTDELDGKLLLELERDSRRSYREIASRLGVSPSTIMTRIQRLQQSKVIKGYYASLDHIRLGYDLTALTEIIVSKGKLLEMEREIAKLPGVCAVYDITGATDGMVVAKFKDREELSRFTKSLLAMPFVERTNTHVVLTTVKEDFRLPP
jgi:DNA-binding Lrp family transcriptional regulator